MSANIFGERFRLISFGESHGPALGAVIDGCPAGVQFDEALLIHQLERRRPGQSQLTTARQEMDHPEVLSGVYQGKTLGTPIAVMVRNKDARSQDYASITTPRAGHADDVWKMKFDHTDPRGGGRSSGRETLTRVIGGSVAQMLLRHISPKIRVIGYTAQLGDLGLSEDERRQVENAKVDEFPARFPSAQAQIAEKKILAARDQGDSLGGVAEILVKGTPQGLGQPVFHKLKADLAAAYFSVGATSNIELGEGAAGTTQSGTAFHADPQGSVYGGIRGGISTGEDLRLRIGFKPTSSILDVAKKGRHDPFIVTRAVPVLEAMTWMVLADHLLWQRTDRV